MPNRNYILDWTEDDITRRYLDRDNDEPYDDTDDRVDDYLLEKEY